MSKNKAESAARTFITNLHLGHIYDLPCERMFLRTPIMITNLSEDKDKTTVEYEILTKKDNNQFKRTRDKHLLEDMHLVKKSNRCVLAYYRNEYAITHIGPSKGRIVQTEFTHK
jgi:hypothetical protein